MSDTRPLKDGTREAAIKALHQCPTCNRWITGGTCDSCWVDRAGTQHTTPLQAIDACKRAIEIGREAERLLVRIKKAAES